MKTLKTRLKKEIKNLYLITGEDFELQNRALTLIENAINLTLPDFNKIVLNDENFSLEECLMACENLPMGDDMRIVVIKDIAKISENDKKLLRGYCKKFSPSTALVIIDSLGTFQFLKDEMEIVNCSRFDTEFLLKVITSEVSKFNKQISEKAGLEIISRCNSYFTSILNEIKKLVAFSENENVITFEMVEKVVSSDKEFVVYELTDALGKKNSVKALSLLHQMEKDQGVFSLISSHVRRMFFASISEGGEGEIASLLGVKEFAVKKARESANNFSKMQLKKIYELVCDVDFMIKSGKMNQTNGLYFLVLQILNQ